MYLRPLRRQRPASLLIRDRIGSMMVTGCRPELLVRHFWQGSKIAAPTVTQR